MNNTVVVQGACVAVVVAVVVFIIKRRRKKLPGRLQPQGEFIHEDPANPSSVQERRRDFSRILATKRDLTMFTTSCRKVGTLIPSTEDSPSEQAAYQQLKFWLQSELAKIPGAVDLATTSSWPIVDRVVNFMSVSPGFDFVLQYKVKPMIMQQKYVVMVSKSGQVRCAWYAFATDIVRPGMTSGPFVLKLVTEDLLEARQKDVTHTVHHYSAAATSCKDMEKIIASHLPKMMKGIDADNWDLYLKA